MPKGLSLEGVRSVFGRALKSQGTLAQMGQMRFAKELGEMLPGSKIYVSGAMSGLPGKNVEAFNRAERYLTGKGFSVLNPASLEKSVPAMYANWAKMSEKRQWAAFMRHDLQMVKQADAVVTMERGSFETLRSATLSRGAKQEVKWARAMGKPVIRASRVEPSIGVMQSVDKHARPMTEADREIIYNRLYPQKRFASIDKPDVADGANTNPWNVETIPLSTRKVDYSPRIGGRRASDIKAAEQAKLSEMHADDIWQGAGTERNPFDQDRRVRHRQNVRRNQELQTPRSFVGTPGRPISNTVPVGGRIEGMSEGWWGKFKKMIGFGSPWRGLIKMPKALVGMYKNELIKKALTSGLPWEKASKIKAGGMTINNVSLHLKKLAGQIERVSALERPSLLKDLGKYAKDLEAAESHGFSSIVSIPEGSHSGRRLRGILKHERVHQIRHLEGNAGLFYGGGLSEATQKEFGRMGYASEKFQEEAIAFGHEVEYLNKYRHTPNASIRESANEIMAFARTEGASSDIRPFIKQRPKAAMIDYRGFQQGFGDRPGFHLFNLLQDIPGHTVGSTVSESTLAKHGIPYEHMIPGKLSHMVQGNSVQAMENMANAQTHSTVAGIASSLHSSRGSRLGPRGGNG